jgi:RNA polymerase-binding transcription factor DksA
MKSRDPLDRQTIQELARALRAKRLALLRLRQRTMYRRQDDAESDEMAFAAASRVAPVDYSRDLADVDHALAQLRQGRYGLCLGCGVFLGLARLRTRPLAERCWACQARAEQGLTGERQVPMAELPEGDPKRG